MPHKMFYLNVRAKKAGRDGRMDIFHINLLRHIQQRHVLRFTMHTNHILEFLFITKLKYTFQNICAG